MLRPLSLFALALVFAACGGEPEPAAVETPADTARVSAIPTAELPPDAEGPLVVYTGRKESLVGPLVEQFREQTGRDVEVRYADDAALIAQLQEEGDRSPADVLWSNTAGALGAATQANLLTVLPDSIRVLPGSFVPAGGQWVPVTVRFRVLAYAPDRVDADQLPSSVVDLPQTAALEGRIGWTPTYSSFQDFLTAYRLLGSDDAAAEWVTEMQESGAKAYPSNTPMLEALLAGEIDVALTNHYYVLRKKAEGANLDYTFFSPGDAGNLALVTGAGVLDTSQRQRAARRFVAFLLSPAAQAFAAETTKEVPVTAGAPSPEGFVPFETATNYSPKLEVERLRELDETLRLLRDQGLL
ncbi:MAG TPA: extracellular solute-binding protein [Bacteroidetes bacterium]|nr:extracellular solute-binding protein [Bacteroidota bacterium]HIL56327.1 extracellular solute-binding protein [Rhodothermales bacterium]